MRWFLGDDPGGLADGLRARGEEVVGGPEHYVTAHLADWDTPNDYPLRRYVEQTGAKVAVLVNPIRDFEQDGQIVKFGYARGHVVALKTIRVLPVMLAADDPATWDAYANHRFRTCGVRLYDCPLYVTSDDGVFARASKSGRVVALWKPGQPVNAIVDAVARLRTR